MALSLQLGMHHRNQKRLFSRLRSWISWQKALRYEAPLLGQFQACTVVSDHELAFVGKLTTGSGCRVEVVPNGVDCEANRPHLVEPMPKTLIFNGALTYDANYDAMYYFLSQIYPLIRQQVPKVTLTITGSPKGVDLESLQIDKSVSLSGYVEDIRPLVAGSAACVVPIRQGGGTRLKILEAMALGTPVVSTSKGAEGLEVTPERDILIADEPYEFAAQVVRLLGNVGLAEQLALQARRLVEEQYDWTEITCRFVDLVEEVAGAQRPREGRRV
jgi:glycosyltransferase involved in cell wall biosynthesis